MELERVDRGGRVQLDLGDDLVAFECAFPVERQPRLHFGAPFEEQPGRDDQRERRSDDDQLRPAKGERPDQAERGEAEVRHEPERGIRRHAVDVPTSSAGGVGTCSSVSRRHPRPSAAAPRAPA